MLKAARYANLICGTGLVVVCGFNIVGIIASFNIGLFLLNFYLAIFGLIIMASCFMMQCVKKNFLFLLTGVGKGAFNIFVGTLLFLNEGAKADGAVMNLIAGWALIASGLAFLFLSKVKNMSDDEMQRALSVYADQQKAGMKQGAKDFAHNHKDDAKKLAYDNKDVIAAVAYDNKDVLA